MDKSVIEKAKSEALTLTPKQQTITAIITANESKFAEVLVGGYASGQFLAICIEAVQKNPKLLSCEPLSLLTAMWKASQVGLAPNTSLHEAALIPYGSKCEFQIEYRGFLKLVWASGMITSIDYDFIGEEDEFEYSKGSNGTFKHVPNLRGRGEGYAYYATAKLKTGDLVAVVMTIDEVRAHAQRFSQAYRADATQTDKKKLSPWTTDFGSMAIKTCLKQLCDKKLPKALTDGAKMLATAVELDSTEGNVEGFKAPKFEGLDPEKEVEQSEPKENEQKTAKKTDSKADPEPPKEEKGKDTDSSGWTGEKRVDGGKHFDEATKIGKKFSELPIEYLTHFAGKANPDFVNEHQLEIDRRDGVLPPVTGGPNEEMAIPDEELTDADIPN